MVHMGRTAVSRASVKMMLFAQLWMVSVLANVDGLVHIVNHSVTQDTMVISVERSVFV